MWSMKAFESDLQYVALRTVSTILSIKQGIEPELIQQSVRNTNTLI